MERYIYNEKNGLWYELQGDYYLPCLKLLREETAHIGIFGQRHRRYLKTHRMDTLIARRTKLQNRIRRAAPAEKENLRQEKAGVTKQITALRKQLKLNEAIEVRSAKIQEKTDLLYANEYRAKEAQQQKKAQRRERDAR